MPYKDPQQRRAYHKKWLTEHPDMMPLYRATYLGKHAARYILLRRVNQQKRVATDPAYAQKRRRHKAESSKRHRARCNVTKRRYMARKAGAPRNDFTTEQWQEMQRAQNHRCWYCGKRCKGKLTQDHILAISQGGSHTLHNVIGACRSCNSKKGARPPSLPVQPFLLSIASRRISPSENGGGESLAS